MQALVQERFGAAAEVLRVHEVPTPTPGPGEVLVEVAAASVNSWDWDKLIGNAYGRLEAPFGPHDRILGADIAGTVAALGEGAEGFRVGEKVFADLSEGKWGGFAEYAVARTGDLAPMPDGLSFVEAAALPQAGALAMQAFRHRPNLRAGERLVLNGAGGGVGTIAIQLAKRAGVQVIAVDSAEKLDALKALGADEVVDYRSTDFTESADSYDMIVDVVANRSPTRYTRCLREGGELVLVGGTIRSLLGSVVFGRLLGRRKRQRLGLLIYKVSAADNAELARMVVEDGLKPAIDSVHPLANGAAAIARLGSGKAIGKVVIAMDGSAS